MKVIAGSARVSSREQSENSYALDQQIARLKAAGATEIFADVASGSKKSRQEFQRLIERIKAETIQEVIATRIDRIARSLPRLREFAALCMEYGVNLKILDQQIDLSTPHGKLMFNLLGSVAEWELDLLKDRVMHGTEYRRSQHRAFGVLPFGYILDDDLPAPDLDLYQSTNQTCWNVAREAVEVFLNIGTIRGTARELGKRYGTRANRSGGGEFKDFPRENGLRYWLCNPILRGHLGYFYRSRSQTTIFVPNTHPSLISSSEFDEIQRLLEIARKGERRGTGDRLPLAGLVYCGLCGSKAKAYRHRKGDRLVIRWYCVGIHTPIQACVKTPSIRYEVIENAVIAALTSRGEQIALMTEEVQADVVDTPEIVELQKSLKAIELLPSNSALVEAQSQITNQIAALRLTQHTQKESQTAMMQDLIEISSSAGFWQWLDNDSKRRLYKRFIDRISIKDGVVFSITLRV